MKTIKLSVLFTVLLLAGCGKSKEDQSAMRLVSRIETFGNPDGSVDAGTTEYRYDEQNRIVETIITNTDGHRTSPSYNYIGNSSILVADTITYTLNSNGFITSISIGDQPVIATAYTYAGEYLQKIEANVSSLRPSKSTQNYTWQNGNIAQITSLITFLTEPPSTHSWTGTYEYDDMPNRPCSVDFFPAMGMLHGLFGKSVLNLPSKETTITKNIEGIDDIDVTVYRYETDSEGYPVRIYTQKNNDSETLMAIIEYKP